MGEISRLVIDFIIKFWSKVILKVVLSPYFENKFRKNIITFLLILIFFRLVSNPFIWDLLEYLLCEEDLG